MSDVFNCNKTCFNDKTWLIDNNAVLCGYVIHADVYVNSLQTIGRKIELQDNGKIFKTNVRDELMGCYGLFLLSSLNIKF